MMSPERCDQELRVSEAIRSGQWRDDLRAHVMTCPICGEAAAAARWMQALADPDGVGRSFSSRDANLLWWRAQLVQECTRSARAQTTLVLANAAWVAFASMVLTAFTYWDWPLAQQAVNQLGSALSPQAWATAYSAAGLSWITIAALILAAGVVAYPFVAEE